MVTAYYRPTFAFDQSLELARTMVEFANQMRTSQLAIMGSRNSALAAWSGPWGAEFRERATEEDANFTVTAAKLRSDADEWGMCWQQACGQMNRVMWAEAYVRQIEHHRNKDNGFLGSGHGPSLGSIFGDSDAGEASKDMPDLRTPTRPREWNNFTVYGDFVRLTNGDSVSHWYTPTAPDPLKGTITRSDWDDAQSQDRPAEPADAPPAEPDPEPVTLEQSRASLGRSNDALCSIDLDLVDEWIADIAAQITTLNSAWEPIPGLAEATRSASEAYSQNNSVATVNLFLQCLNHMHVAVTAVRQAVGADGSGVITVENSVIDEALRMAGADEAPGLIQPSDQEFFGMPENSGVVDDPINAATGNFFHHEVDLDMPGFATSIETQRVYNAAVLKPGRFGLGWASVLDMALVENTRTGSVDVTLPDGGVRTFAQLEDGTYARWDARRVTLERTAAGWLVTQGHDMSWHFDAEGRLAGGHAHQAAWTVHHSVDQIVVTDSVSRRSTTYSLTNDLVTSAVTSDGRRADYHHSDGILTGVDRPSGAMTYEIGADDRIKALVDADGVRIAENTYDRWGRAASQISQYGRVSHYVYGENGTFRATDENDGPANVLVHDRLGNMTAMIAGDGQAMRMKWDARNRMTELRDRAGHVTTYTYDDDLERDLLTGITYPDGGSETRDYDDLDRIVTVTRPDTGTWTLTYDGLTRLPATVTNPVNAVTIFDRNELGLPVTITDPDGVATTMTWTDDGQIETIVDGRGRTVTFTYDPSGALTSRVDHTGNGVHFASDNAGRPVSVVSPDGATETLGWTAAGRPAWCLDANGATKWALDYAGHGEAAQLTDAAGGTVQFSYDVMGNRDGVVAPDGAHFDFEYDDVNQLVAIEHDGTTLLHQQFDPNGHLIEASNGDGHAVRRSVDHLGRTTELVGSAGATTQIAYHPGGTPATVTLATGARFGFEVDLMNRVTAVVGPDGATTRYAYSPGGRLLTHTSPAGRETQYSYDAAGHLAQIIDPAGRTTSADDVEEGLSIRHEGDVVTLSFDDAGRLESWTNTLTASAGSLGWDSATVRVATDDTVPAIAELDPAGRLHRITDPAGVSSEYGYDNRGRINEVVTAHTHRTELDYNALNQITAIRDTGADALALHYSPGGLLAAIESGDDALVHLNRDPAGRIMSVQAADADAPVIQYSYEPSGLVVGTETDAGRTTLALDDYGSVRQVVDTNGARTTYGRDLDGLVTSIDVDGLSTISVLRSADGALTGFRSDDIEVAAPTPITAPGAQRDRAGRLLSDQRNRAHRYDEAGRLAETVDGDGNRWGFDYGSHGLIERETNPFHGERTFTYNAAGQLIAIVEGDGVTRFDYDGRGRRSHEMTPSGETRTYRWNVLDQLIGIDTVDARGIARSRTIEWSGWNRPERIDDIAIGYDDVMSHKPIRIGDDQWFRSGTQTCRIAPGETWNDGLAADPFGWNDADGVALGYRGELTVDGLVLMGERVYDPRSRIFLSRDTAPLVAAAPGGSNSYQFAYCDPINNLDPTGRSVMSQDDFEAWRERQESTRLGLLVDAVVDDPLGAIMVVGLVVVAVAALAIPGAGPLITAAAVGALVSMTVTVGTQLAARDVNLRKVAVDGVIGAAAGAAGAGAGAFAGNLVKPLFATGGKFATSAMSNVAPKIITGVASGAASGAVSSASNETIAQIEAGEFDPGGFLTTVATGTFVGAVTGAVPEAVPTSGLKYPAAASAAVNGLTESGGAVLEDVIAGRPIDVTNALVSGFVGAGADLVSPGGDADVSSGRSRPGGNGIPHVDPNIPATLAFASPDAAPGVTPDAGTPDVSGAETGTTNSTTSGKPPASAAAPAAAAPDNASGSGARRAGPAQTAPPAPEASAPEAPASQQAPAESSQTVTEKQGPRVTESPTATPDPAPEAAAPKTEAPQQTNPEATAPESATPEAATPEAEATTPETEATTPDAATAPEAEATTPDAATAPEAEAATPDAATAPEAEATTPDAAAPEAEATAPEAEAEAEAQPVDAEAEAEAVETETEAQPVDAEAEAEAQPVEAETDAQPVKAEAEAQPVKAEAEAQPVETETEAQPIDTEAEAQPADAETEAQPVEAETDTQPVDAEAQPVDAEAEAQPVDAEADADTQLVETETGTQPVDTDAKTDTDAKQEPAATDAVTDRDVTGATDPSEATVLEQVRTDHPDGDAPGLHKPMDSSVVETVTGAVEVDGVVVNQVVLGFDADGNLVEAQFDLTEVFEGADRTSAEESAQRKLPGKGEGDHAGHAVAHRFMLDQGADNMFPQDGNFNTSAYKKFENEMAAYLENGGRVEGTIQFEQHNDVGRPDIVRVETTVTNNGQPTTDVYERFDNEAGQKYDRKSTKEIKQEMANA